MSFEIGLDSSFIIGLLDDQDLWRPQTLQLQTALQTAGFKPVVFDCVLAETVSTLARRTHEKRRAVVLPKLLAELKAQFPVKAMIWVYPEVPALYEQVVALVESSGGELNFNDALIVLACRQRGIDYLASFDTDFDRVEGLKRLATPADLPA